MATRKKGTAAAALAIAVGLALSACSPAVSTSVKTSASSAPGVGGSAIGFIMVGPKDDFGYNQAVYEGSQVIAKKYPKLKVLTAENVPEDDTAATTMEQM